MKIRWNKLLTNIAIWAIAEITFNFFGLDTLADYSEFLLARYQSVNLSQAIVYQ